MQTPKRGNESDSDEKEKTFKSVPPRLNKRISLDFGAMKNFNIPMHKAKTALTPRRRSDS